MTATTSEPSIFLKAGPLFFRYVTATYKAPFDYFIAHIHVFITSLQIYTKISIRGIVTGEASPFVVTAIDSFEIFGFMKLFIQLFRLSRKAG